MQEGDSLSPALPFRIINIGNSNKVRLLDFIDTIKVCLRKKANLGATVRASGTLLQPRLSARPTAECIHNAYPI